MNLNLTPTAIKAAQTKKRAKPGKAKPSARLPGESHPFVPITKRTLEQLNLVPPQHLGPNGSIVSSRAQEVTQDGSSASPLALRIQTLEAENASLRAQLEALQ